MDIQRMLDALNPGSKPPTAPVPNVPTPPAPSAPYYSSAAPPPTAAYPGIPPQASYGGYPPPPLSGPATYPPLPPQQVNPYGAQMAYPGQGRGDGDGEPGAMQNILAMLVRLFGLLAYDILMTFSLDIAESSAEYCPALR